MTVAVDRPGFSDPVHGAQTCFRAILTAMSQPGTIQDVRHDAGQDVRHDAGQDVRHDAGQDVRHDAGQGAGDDLLPPAPLDVASAATLLTLVDPDTSLAIDRAWMDGSSAAALEWIRFHCAVGFSEMAQAAFVFAARLPDLAALSCGSDVAPEDGATVILQVAALGSGDVWMLDGPGLPSVAPLAITGLPEDFAARWAENHARFPRGVDLILCAGSRLASIPRSVQVRRMEGAA